MKKNKRKSKWDALKEFLPPLPPPPPPRPKHVGRINLRVTEKDFNLYKARADMYMKGNLSNWIRYCLDNFYIEELVVLSDEELAELEKKEREAEEKKKALKEKRRR